MNDDEPQWYQSAACRGTDDPDAWYLSARTSDEKRRVARAKRICAYCPVRVACEEHAEKTQQPFGIWGGKRRNRLGYTSGHVDMQVGANSVR